MPVYGPPTFEENKDIDQKLQERFTQEFVTARDEYARLSAGRGRRTFPNFIKGKDFSKKALAEARENYDKAFKELVDQEKIVAKNAGLKNSEIKRVASASAAENEYSLTTSIYQYRMVATGRGNFDQKGKFQLIEPKTPFGRAANRFYDWWGKQDGKKGMLKKAGAAAGIGFVVGVPTALAGTILLGPIAGGAVGVAAANRLTKSWMVSKISERSRDRKYVEDLDSNLQAEIINPSNGKFGNIVDQQTNNEVKRNRKRMAKIAGMAAIGGFGGALVGDALGLEHVIGGSGHAHAHVASTHPNTHPASKGGHRHPKAEAANPSSKPAAPINHANTVNGNQFNGEYVSTVYEQHLGLHQGFTNMEQAANLAQQHHALKLISDPSNPNHFFYQTADGQESTDSVLKVLDKYGGKVKVR
jgi:hypothetical protein